LVIVKNIKGYFKSRWNTFSCY